jgi:hypothetical protein
VRDILVQRAVGHMASRCDCPVHRMALPPSTVVNCLMSQCFFFDNTLPSCTCRNADLAPCRKPPAKTAWTQGTNPITQRPTHSSTPNGAVNSPKAPQSSTAASADNASPMRHLSDRMMYLLANLTVSDSWLSMRRERTALMIPTGSSGHHHAEEW